MQGWIVSDTIRANRHWQSGSEEGLSLDIFKNYRDSMSNITTDDWTAFNSGSKAYTEWSRSLVAQNIFCVFDKSVTGPFFIPNPSWGHEHFTNTLPETYTRTQSEYFKISVDVIKKSLPVQDMNIYYSGIAIQEGLSKQKKTQDKLTWSYPSYNVLKTEMKRLGWGSSKALPVETSPEYMENGTYEDDGVFLKAKPRSGTETIYSPKFSFWTRPTSPENFTGNKEIESANIENGFDVFVHFKDTSKCNFVALTQFAFITNNYELEHWDYYWSSTYNGYIGCFTKEERKQCSCIINVEKTEITAEEFNNA